MQDHLISVIVPVYNVEPYLVQCLDSIIAQTYTNLEIILVDDGSPDNCPAICDSYANSDHRIKVIHKKNGGLSSARNTGLEIATGEYIGYIDSDDYIAPDMYEKMLRLISADGQTGAVACMYMTLKRERVVEWNTAALKTLRKPSSEMFDEAINPSYGVTVWNKLYRRSVIKDILFYEGLNAEDNLYHYQVCLALERQGMDMAFLPDKLYYYRSDNPESICNNLKKPVFIDALQIHRIMIGLTDNPARKKLCYSAYYRYISGLCLQFVINKEYRKLEIPGMQFGDLRKEIKGVPLGDLRGNCRNSFKIDCCNLLLKYCPVLYKIIIPPAYRIVQFLKRARPRTGLNK